MICELVQPIQKSAHCLPLCRWQCTSLFKVDSGDQMYLTAHRYMCNATKKHDGTALKDCSSSIVAIQNNFVDTYMVALHNIGKVRFQ